MDSDKHRGKHGPALGIASAAGLTLYGLYKATRNKKVRNVGYSETRVLRDEVTESPKEAVERCQSSLSRALRPTPPLSLPQVIRGRSIESLQCHRIEDADMDLDEWTDDASPQSQPAAAAAGLSC